MDDLINPLLLYLACALGAVGVALALPRRGASWALPGGVLAAITGGGVILAMSLAAGGVEQVPSPFFYFFSILALGAGLRMITHPRPVYSALYFILTIVASSGLYVLLSAEFMAFALIIIYAGAILITYLFVIMLATQAPREGEDDMQADYDSQAREPMLASAVGFAMLAALSTMVFSGIGDLPPPKDAAGHQQAVLERLPGKVESALWASGAMGEDETVLRVDDNGQPVAAIDLSDKTAQIVAADGSVRTLEPDAWPEDLAPSNVEMVGYSLLVEHPGAIEIAGVILLMAMLGATVLSRRQVEIDEAAKAHEARRLGDTLGDSLGSQS